MPIRQLILNTISFTYPGSINPVILHLSAHFPEGWTGVVGANGCGKTTLLRIAAGELHPQEGTVSSGFQTVLCAQRTDSPPEQLPAFLETMEADARILIGTLGIGEDWFERWETLSHGERKRAQIATSLWRRPDILAIDEPTNHIDHDTRLMLIHALRSYDGVGIIVSHDRALLDMLCGQCLFLGDEPVIRPGGYTMGTAEQERGIASRRRERHKAQAQYRRLKREADNRRAEASVADRKRSKKAISRKDHDARAKIDLARISGKDGVAGKRLNQIAGRLEQAGRRLKNATVPKLYARGIWVSGTHAKRPFLWRLDENVLPLGKKRTLHVPVLAMQPEDRIGITGANGTGKSTLIRYILEYLEIPRERLVYLPQEITVEQSRQLMRDIRELPCDALGHVMEIVSRLNSRPERLMETDTPSPGEIRKLMLARGILRDPYLIVMDEPTNHLDLPAIESLEEALAQSPCGLLLVSHDRTFLANTVDYEWAIVPRGDGGYMVATIPDL